MLFPKPGGPVLSPDFGQIRRWAVNEMGLKDYTWRISETALHGEFGLVCLCIFNYSRLYRRLKVRVCLVHGGDIPTLESPLDYKYVPRVYEINNNHRSTQINLGASPTPSSRGFLPGKHHAA
jgi:hypothetical protein